MGPRWLFAVCSIALLAINARAASVSTQDTVVVAKSETDKSEQSEVTTEGPLLPIKVSEMLINSDVSLRYAHTSIVSRVRNPAHRAQQTTFHVLLPETAFITGFAMALGNKTYQSRVAGKQEAKKIYSDAVSEGTSAGHISARARDSNHFTVTVNVEPNSDALFNLTYEELLVRRNGVYSLDINVLPRGFVPDFRVDVNINESQNITVLTVPKEGTGDEDEAIDFKNLKEPPRQQLVGIRLNYDRKTANVIFTPDREEQIRLMQIYADKTKESTLESDHWYLHQKDDENSTETPGQFVVQYDVERPEKGEILVNDGYFAYFFAPPNLNPLSTYAIFVLDTSEGRIDYLQDAMRTILDDLRPTDYFNIIDFHSNVKVLNISDFLQYPSPRDYSWYRRDDISALPPPTPATAENIERAKTIVSKIDAYGGTDIYDALDEAVDLVNKKFGKENGSADDKRTESDVNTDDLQPIIIMITTGNPSVGIKDADRIVNDITKKNSERRAPIYTIACEKDAGVELLRKISQKNNGFMRRIYPDTDASLQVKNYYQQIASPLLANVTFTYPPNQVKEDTVTEYTISSYFLGEEIVLFGELAEGATELEPTVQAVGADDKQSATKHYEVQNKVVLTEKKEYFPLERLWAYSTIKKLLEELKTYEFDDKKNEQTPEKRALELALKYEFVTPLTSLVVVKTNTTEVIDEDDDEDEDAVSSTTPRYSKRPIGRPYEPPFHNYPSITGGPFIGLPTYTARPYASTYTTIHHPGLTGSPNILHSHVNDVGASPASNGLSYAQSLDATADLMESSKDDPYHLQDFSWALTILRSSSDSLEFVPHGKNVSLLVTKSNIAPRDSKDIECTVSAVASSTGEARVCVYLTRCAAARDITPDDYRNTYCTVQERYAGFCCPVSEVDKESK